MPQEDQDEIEQSTRKVFQHGSGSRRRRTRFSSTQRQGLNHLTPFPSAILSCPDLEFYQFCKSMRLYNIRLNLRCHCCSFLFANKSMVKHGTWSNIPTVVSDALFSELHTMRVFALYVSQLIAKVRFDRHYISAFY